MGGTVKLEQVLEVPVSCTQHLHYSRAGSVLDLASMAPIRQLSLFPARPAAKQARWLVVILLLARARQLHHHSRIWLKLRAVPLRSTAQAVPGRHRR